MLKTVLLIAALFFAGTASASILVTPSQPLDIHFSGLPFIEYLGYQDQGGFIVTLSDTNPLDSGDVIRVELFEDGALTRPIWLGGEGGYYFDFYEPTDSFAMSVINAFQDNQGGIRFTALFGSVSIDSVFARMFVDGNQYGENIISTSSIPVSIPEPETLVLFMTGLFVMKVRRGQSR